MGPLRWEGIWSGDTLKPCLYHRVCNSESRSTWAPSLDLLQPYPTQTALEEEMRKKRRRTIFQEHANILAVIAYTTGILPASCIARRFTEAVLSTDPGKWPKVLTCPERRATKHVFEDRQEKAKLKKHVNRDSLKKRTTIKRNNRAGT